MAILKRSQESKAISANHSNAEINTENELPLQWSGGKLPTPRDMLTVLGHITKTMRSDMILESRSNHLTLNSKEETLNNDVSTQGDIPRAQSTAAIREDIHHDNNDDIHAIASLKISIHYKNNENTPSRANDQISGQRHKHPSSNDIYTSKGNRLLVYGNSPTNPATRIRNTPQCI